MTIKNQKLQKNFSPLIFLALTLGLLIFSCRPLPKEAPGNWIELNLRLASTPHKIKRSGTGIRGSELAIALPSSIKFSEQGPNSIDALSWSKVDTTTNTVSLLLPTNELLQLFVYRYTEDYSLFELEQLLFNKSLHLNSIDFGKSEVFSISSSETKLLVNGEASPSLTIQLARQLRGKLAQTYVMGAQVWADKIELNGNFNHQLDQGEINTVSGADGEYYIAPNYLDYILVTKGGFKLDSSGAYVAAAPMIATIPNDGKTEVHITPLTTLVAKEPKLADIFAESGDWRNDIASKAGVPGDLLRISKVTEAFWMLLSGGSNPVIETTQQQISAFSILARNFVQGGREMILANLPSIIEKSVEETLNSPQISRELNEDTKAILSSELTELAANLVQLLPDNDQEVEAVFLTDFDRLNRQAFDSVESELCNFSEGVSVQFDPIILSISLVPTSETTIAVRGTISDDDVEALTTYWAINPPEELKEAIKSVLINAVVNESGNVENTFNVNNCCFEVICFQFLLLT